MSALRYDKDAIERLLAIYVTPDVAAQRNDFLEMFGPRPAERVRDVGSGPGLLATAMAERVGPSGRVCGVDISEPLLAVARSRCAHQPWVEFRDGDAARLPFPDQAFDAVVSTQVLEYVRDADAALAEFHRVVRPGGRVGFLTRTGTRWSGIRPIGNGCAEFWPPGMSMRRTLLAEDAGEQAGPRRVLRRGAAHSAVVQRVLRRRHIQQSGHRPDRPVRRRPRQDHA